MHPHIQRLLQCIALEEKEQAHRYQLDQQHTLKSLKAEGLALHPLVVTRKTFGYGDYPEITFKLNFPPEANLFRDGAAIECFTPGEEPVKGVLLSLDGKSGEFRLFAPDFPDWIEDGGVGIKLAPDTRTTSIMKKVLNDLTSGKGLYNLFEKIHTPRANKDAIALQQDSKVPLHIFKNQNLNESQRQAVTGVVNNDEIMVIHGPPGTGKTTTLVEAVIHLVNAGEKVLVSAPSNTAVDNISKGLVQQGIKLLRVGNTTKVDAMIFSHTPEGKLANSRQQKEIKELKKRADEFRRMAHKYKRSFGKAEREQRNLLFKEVKNIRQEIKKLEAYNEEKLFSESDVIAGTPIGLYDAGVEKFSFQTIVIDEAGQCIEPLAWCVFPMADKIVLAGDHWQLPPTVLSNEAAMLGFNRSILEVVIESGTNAHLLDIQYRMREAIAGFSSDYFYHKLLRTAAHLVNTGVHIEFIDTAGTGYNEQRGTDGLSLQNNGELDIARQVVEKNLLDPAQLAFISPYAAQVAAARDIFPKDIRVSTIDSFQGQEKDIIIVSLVRSNDEGEIGFLKDYRRMNVAMTRAKERLIVIGDSATIGADAFYNSFLTYVEKNGRYSTAWEFDLL